MVFVVLGLASPRLATAQSQQNSWQASGTVLIVGSNYTVPGGELQYRRTFSEWSLGGGAQLFYDPTKVCSTPSNCTTAGAQTIVFVEPRWVAGHTDQTAFYLAGRLGYSGSLGNGGVVYGGGGGLIQILNPTFSLDLGAQVYAAPGSSAVAQLRAGLSVGF